MARIIVVDSDGDAQGNPPVLFVRSTTDKDGDLTWEISTSSAFEDGDTATIATLVTTGNNDSLEICKYKIPEKFLGVVSVDNNNEVKVY